MVASAVAATVAIAPPDDRVVQAVGEALDAGGEYHKLTPERIFDSRTRDLDVEPYGPKSTNPLGSSVAFDVPVVGLADLPAPRDVDSDGYDDNVLAVVVNIIVIDPTQLGYLRAFPAGATEGDTSVVNFPAGTTVPNTAVIRPGIAGEISIRLVSPPGVGTADVAIDISGWFSTQQHTERGARLIPISPIRAYDSALPQFGGGTLGARSLTEVPILQGLLANGMGQGPALALLLAGPALSLPNMLVIASVIGWKKTSVFVALVVVMATLSGITYGHFFA